MSDKSHRGLPNSEGILLAKAGTEVNFEPNVALLAHEIFGPSNPDKPLVELLTNPHLQTIPK